MSSTSSRLFWVVDVIPGIKLPGSFYPRTHSVCRMMPAVVWQYLVRAGIGVGQWVAEKAPILHVAPLYVRMPLFYMARCASEVFAMVACDIINFREKMAKLMHQATEKYVERLKESRQLVRVVVLGDTGSGKSTLINNLLDQAVATVGDGPNEVTTVVNKYEGTLDGANAIVFDTPNLNDSAIEELRNVIEYRHTVVVVCIKMKDKHSNQHLVKMLDDLGVNRASNRAHTMVALTFADVVLSMQPGKGEYAKTRAFEALLASWRERLVREFWQLDALRAFPVTKTMKQSLSNCCPFADIRAAIASTFSLRVLVSYDPTLEDECRLTYGKCLSRVTWNEDGAWALNRDQTNSGFHGLFHPLFVTACDVDAERLRTRKKRPQKRAPPTKHAATFNKMGLYFETELKDWHNMCEKCKCLPVKPRQTSCCGLSYCSECFDELLQKSSQCTNCNEDWSGSFEDKKLEKLIYNLKVHCWHHAMGCDWTGELRCLSQHLASDCEFELVKCPNEGCSIDFERFFTPVHTQHECHYRKIHCPFCFAYNSATNPPGTSHKEFVFRDLILKHLKTCPHLPVRCPNLCEDRHWTRDTLNQHLAQCAKKVIPCDFKPFGCQVTKERSNMSAHLDQEMRSHLSMLMSSHLDLQKEVNELKQQQSK